MTIAGAALVVLWLFASGRGPGYTVQIDFSWGRGFLDSAAIEIDGEVVGVLDPRGSQYVSGFRVEAGEHTVRVLKDGCEGVPEHVTLGASTTRLAILMADVEDEARCRVILR